MFVKFNFNIIWKKGINLPIMFFFLFSTFILNVIKDVSYSFFDLINTRQSTTYSDPLIRYSDMHFSRILNFIYKTKLSLSHGSATMVFNCSSVTQIFFHPLRVRLSSSLWQSIVLRLTKQKGKRTQTIKMFQNLA